MMSFRFPVLLVISFSLIFLGGCAEPEGESSVNGQIFVVVPGGDNVPLGLVQVFFFDEGTISGFLDQRGREIDEKRKDLEARRTRKVEELRGTIQSRDQMRGELESQEADFIVRRTALVDDLREMVANKTREIESNKAFAEDMDVIPPPPEGAPSRAEFEAYDEKRRKWLSMSRNERTAWQSVLLQQNRDLRANIDGRLEEGEEQIQKWEETLVQIGMILDNYNESVRERQAEVAELDRELGLFPTVDDYLGNLPTPMKKVRTDANGEFSVALPANRKMGLVATIKRDVRNREEEHAWFVWVETGQGPHERILLSNHNSLTEIAGGEPLALQ